MAVVLLGRGQQADPDDEKARKTDQLCQDWFRLLRDPSFTSKLPAGMKDKLNHDVSAVGFALAVYRGELAKEKGDLSGHCKP
jgi:hypothetical protein